MRILLSKNSRRELFLFLKEKYSSKSFPELAKRMKISFKTLKKWMYAELYMPKNIIPNEFQKIEVIDEQNDNWGAVKAGKIGGKRSAELLMKKLGEKNYSKMMQQRGKKAINTLLKKYGIKKLTKMIVEGKIKKREKESKRLEYKNRNFFTNELVILDLQDVLYSHNDKNKKINFPKKMTKELSEEIGVHLGDGCLSKGKNYFSVKTNKKEEGYMRNYLFPLYKKIYNLDLRLMTLPSVVGFEVYSKALCEFKNKVIGLPYGEKIHRIEVPRAVIATKNKEIYCALIRGLFDTDGCLSIIKRNNKEYPVISITIKSEKLIQQVEDMLRKMGFIPNSNNKSYIALSGWVMLKKWVEEIGSNNPKNILNLNRASSSVDRIFPCGLKQ